MQADLVEAATMTIPIPKIIAAMDTKPDGWYSEVMRAGTVVGDTLHISSFNWLRLTARYKQTGDAVAVFARPVAKLIGKNPDCGGCAKRGKALNHGGDLV